MSLQNPIHPGNLACFMDVYAEELTKSHAAKPEYYGYPAEKLLDVIARMEKAISSGGYNHDSLAFKATAKRLGIKHTRTAIEAFIRL